MLIYPTPSIPAAYASASEAFGCLVARLGTPESLGAEHAGVERMIASLGTEVLRRVFEAWVNERAAAEPRRDVVVGDDDVARTHHRSASRSIESRFGTVYFWRDRVSSAGVSSRAPVDAVLNLPADRFSFGVRERVVEEAIRGSFESAVKAVGETTGASVAKRQAEEIVRAAAVDFTAFYAEDAVPVASDAQTLLVLTADGKGIVMRADGLRDATRQAAEKGSHKLERRLSKGEKKNRKRMAEVAAVYDLPRVPRSEDDVVGELDRTATTTRPRARNKRVWASIEKPLHTVIAEMFDEAHRRDPEHQRRWVALVDGNKSQIREIRSAARREGVEVTLVLDVIHVIEYLWSAAWDVFAEGDPAAEKWVRKYLTEILRGRAPIVAAAIRRAATVRKLEKRAGIDKAAAYLLKYKAMLRYDLYLRDGLPIATGVIEGACRHLVKDRMDITGARWGLKGAEAILQLRSLATSGDLAAYWEFHQGREFWRNHASGYAASEDAWVWRAAA